MKIICGNPKDVAIIDADNDTKVSYGELIEWVDEQVGTCSSQLKEKSLVFLFCENTLHWIVDYLSFIAAGHAVALFDSKIDNQMQDKLVDTFDPHLVIYDDNVVYRKSKCQPHKDLSLLLSTSGSTGSSKLVRLTLENIVDNAKNISAALGITSQDRAITSLPLYYSYGLSVINSHLYSGGSVVVTNKGIVTKEFWNAVRDNRCTSFAGVPVMYDMFRKMKIERKHLPDLKVMTQAGGKMNDDNVLYFHNLMKNRGGKLFVMYGQTEATARIAVMPPDSLPEKIGFAGKVLPNGKIIIANGGHIEYCGKNVMMGYAECSSDLSKGDELNGHLRTGDIGLLDNEGFLKITGRVKRFTKINGNRINLDELESMFREYLPSCAVVSDNESIFVFCLEIDIAKAISGVSKKTKIFHSIFKHIHINEYPLNSNGKIDYSRLQSIAKDGSIHV